MPAFAKRWLVKITNGVPGGRGWRAARAVAPASGFCFTVDLLLFVFFSFAPRADVRPVARAARRRSGGWSPRARKRKPLVSPDRLRGPLIAADAKLTTSPGCRPAETGRDREVVEGKRFGSSGARHTTTTARAPDTGQTQTERRRCKKERKRWRERKRPQITCRQREAK